MKAYRIRNKNNEYACGNTWQFSNEGKLWFTIKRVKQHLGLFKERDYPEQEYFYDIPDDWIVEEYDLIKVNEFNAKKLMEESK